MCSLDIPTCADLLGRIEREAEDTLKKATSLIIGSEGSRAQPSKGSVGPNTNTPGAEVWGIGKSKL